jgi:hypothetical protein
LLLLSRRDRLDNAKRLESCQLGGDYGITARCGGECEEADLVLWNVD